MNFILGPLVLLSAFAFVFAQGAMQPPPGSILPVNQTVLNGTSVTFECKFPNVTYVLWAFNGRGLRHGDMYGSNLHTPFKLIFAKVDYRVHVGSYQCFHYNQSVKMYESPLVYLDIQYMERDFQQQPKKKNTAVTGDTVTFNCVGPDSYPPITDVFWYKELSNDTVVQVLKNSRVQLNGTDLVLMDVVQTDGGFYYCNVTNGVFWRKSGGGLLLVNPLKRVVKLVNVTASKKKIYVLPGDSVLLECTVYYTSNWNEVLNSSFVWTYNGGKIPAEGRNVLPNGSLLLEDAREDIAGDYICTGRLNSPDDAGEASDTIHVAIAKIPGPPTVDPPADTIGRGRDVNFTCNPPPEAEPPPSLLWLRNGVELTSVLNPVSRSGLKLSLKSLTLSDEGNYTCQAENLAGRKSSVAWLTVEEYPNISVTTEPAREGGKTKLTCTSTSAHATEFMWYHNGSQIFNASEKYLFSGKILTIRDISRADLGQYTCTVRDIIHVPRSGAADLTFTDQLYLKRQPANVTKIVNETATFTCEFRYHSNDSWTVVWFHGNPELTPNSRISFNNKTNGDHSLTISKISVRDHGMYTCKAVPNNTRTNMGMDEVIGSFFLTAVVPISVEQQPPEEVNAKVGEKLRIDCKAHGHPPPLIEWKSVNSHTGNFVDLKNGSLVFSSLKLNDSGVYTCTVFPAVNNGAAPLTYNTRVVVYTPEQEEFSLPRDTIVIIVVGLIAILLYLVVFIICLCVCAQCYRNSLRKKKLELVAMEADMMRTNRKLSESKDNSAILREVGTPMLSTGPVHPPSNMYTIPQTPSPPGTRRMETSFMDGFTSYTTGIRSPLPPVPTVVSDGTELPNFSRGNLKLGDRLGEGEFGPVLLGQAFGLTNNNMPVDVAIKVWLHPRDEDEETADNDLMNFYNQMRLQFDNIASIVGMCTDVEPYYIIYEYLDRGDLKQFLLECRPDEMDVPPLTQENLLHITKQVANGMAYLSSQLIIHGDLAARNCLISSDLRVKVADLGIGHDVYRDDYYDNGEQLLPVRWMPPEILNVPEFTLHSDIWSFGVFCWEVFAFGRLPYDDITDEEVLRLVPQGLRPEVPEEGCPLALYSLMRDCWSPQPEARPKFTQLVVAIIDLNLD